MRLFRYALTAILVVILGVAIYQTMLWLGVWGNFDEPQVKALDGSDQEIALIEPATSTDDWGRLVTAIQLLQLDWPKVNANLSVLNVDLEGAFPPLTADVPEISFSFGGSSQGKLCLRWYKISAENDAASWVRKLRARSCQPLAVLGGGTSDRAVKLAYTLRKTYGDNPAQPAPVLLLTTATSEKTTSGKSLINVYNGRTFRFSFTNQKMVDALLAFVQHRQPPAKDPEWTRNLWVGKTDDPSSSPKPGPMHTVTWEDERYSQDMTELFERNFKAKFPNSEYLFEGPISYSLGGFIHAAPQEQARVGTLLAGSTPVKPHSMLVLPTQTVRMRRFLINLRQRSPSDARNLVVLNGDAISFNSVYRDREVVWNILDLPYSLVFFSHRNPIDHAAGFTWTKGNRAADAVPQQTTTGTQDVLLYRDVFEAFLYAAADKGNLLSDPIQVRDRLRETCWHYPPLEPAKARVCNRLVHPLDALPFFDADGNRQSHTGEHIVWVKPNFTDDRVDLVSKVSVWAMHPDKNGGAWRLVEAVDATYNQSGLEDVAP
jgi:hypothetical protein